MDYLNRKSDDYVLFRIAPSFIRLAVGLFFLLIGINHINNLENFVDTISKLDFTKEYLPLWMTRFYGYLLPPIEILFGSLVLLGLLTRISSFILTLVIISILLVSPSFDTTIFNYPFNKDYIILAASLSLVLTGSGYISLDYLFKKKKRRY